MKLRKHTWFDVENVRVLYGIQCKAGETDGYLNVAIDGEPCLYETEEERDRVFESLKSSRSLSGND